MTAELIETAYSKPSQQTVDGSARVVVVHDNSGITTAVEVALSNAGNTVAGYAVLFEATDVLDADNPVALLLTSMLLPPIGATKSRLQEWLG